ncbi:PLP-dependent aminotransferase family protein [Amycolatopsis sp. 195334CR]|uniref:MocR-like pyridoxine biosynthesis transcription factor PdxR n=1 Tax=Amycolatopsis sp. 195334CR TaxID=2814588 RepID=UPI001A8D090B|nr:PLP-dependent aminotransferase family protein [Amycolatopsis sp. 195334CR]MBN6033839.1 PLP-dependent aminotransferase family protein [Amycolatopsis sp. 195334CR]
MAVLWSSSRDLHLDWQPGSGQRGLAEAIRRAIRSGRLETGTALPSTRALAEDLGVARGTVTKAYAQLAVEGYLRTTQGAPTRVAAIAAPQASPARSRPSSEAPADARWNLLPGRPDLAAFPRTEWLAATRKVLQQAPPDVFGYTDDLGAPVLRTALARYLARSRGVVADPDRILVCGGFAQAISVLAAALHHQGVHEMAFEDPSLRRFRDLASAAGQRIVGVPVDGAGLRVSDLDSPVAVVTPAHQFPLGVTLAPERRAELARWVTSSGAFAVEDDYDGEFRFDREPVGALQSLAPERFIYAGTASKTLAPALRLGWLVLPRALVDPVRAVMADRGSRPPALSQHVLAEMLESGKYDQHVRRRRTVYRNRRDRLLSLLPQPLQPSGISAGLHLLVPLPAAGPDEAVVLDHARRHSLALETLRNTWISPGPHPQGIVVGYAAPADHAFTPAIDALMATLRGAGISWSSGS